MLQEKTMAETMQAFSLLFRLIGYMVISFFSFPIFVAFSTSFQKLESDSKNKFYKERDEKTIANISLPWVVRTVRIRFYIN